MATFREIDERLLALVDEDGEILDVEEFKQLEMDRTAKIEGLAEWCLALKDEQDVLKREIDRLTTRKRSAERKEAQLRDFLQVITQGEKVKTARITVSFRQTEAVEIFDENAVREIAQRDPRFEDVLRYKAPEINKVEIKRLINEMKIEVPGAAVVGRLNTIIK